jgi:acyl carrier protein
MDRRLLHIIRDVCKCAEDSLGGDVRLRDIQGWDSLAHMELIVSMEGAYGLQFTGDEIAAMQTVGDIWKTIEAKRNPVKT